MRAAGSDDIMSVITNTKFTSKNNKFSLRQMLIDLALYYYQLSNELFILLRIHETTWPIVDISEERTSKMLMKVIRPTRKIHTYKCSLRGL